MYLTPEAVIGIVALFIAIPSTLAVMWRCRRSILSQRLPASCDTEAAGSFLPFVFFVLGQEMAPFFTKEFFFLDNKVPLFLFLFITFKWGFSHASPRS